MRAFILATVALWSGACASLPPASPPALVPSAPLRSLTVGINDGFHGPLPAALVARYCGAGRSLPIRTPHRSGETLAAFMASTAPCPALKTVALVEENNVALAVDLARLHPDAIEICNECELPPLELTIPQHAAFLRAAYAAVRAVNPTIPIIIGGVYTLNDTTKTRVLALMNACPDCAVGLHLYGVLTDADLDWIRDLRRPVDITETGSPTGCGQAKWQEQADWLRSRVNLFSTVLNIEAVYIYQRPSAGDCSDLATFGIEGKTAEALVFGP